MDANRTAAGASGEQPGRSSPSSTASSRGPPGSASWWTSSRASSRWGCRISCSSRRKLQNT